VGVKPDVYLLGSTTNYVSSRDNLYIFFEVVIHRSNKEKMGTTLEP